MRNRSRLGATALLAQAGRSTLGAGRQPGARDGSTMVQPALPAARHATSVNGANQTRRRSAAAEAGKERPILIATPDFYGIKVRQQPLHQIQKGAFRQIWQREVNGGLNAGPSEP